MTNEQSISPRIGIVADDLTSAADGAGPFVEHGLSAHVGLRNYPKSVADVISVDTGSRGFGCVEARQMVAAATLRLRHAELLYKTVDSTLRGNVKAEVTDAFRVSGRRRLVVAPAFPAAGRTTSNGVQLIDGVPVADTIYGRQLTHPAKTSQISDLVGGIVADTFILDAETQDDLDQQVAAFPDKREVLWVGSPGLAKALAATIAPHVSVTRKLPALRSILVVVGSANRVSRIQAEKLHGLRAVRRISAPQKLCREPKSVMNVLVDEAEREICTNQYDAVIATGGETMDALLKRLCVTEFSLEGELEPGFPFGTVRRQRNSGSIIIAMKAGGFGGPNTLRIAATQLLGWATM